MRNKPHIGVAVVWVKWSKMIYPAVLSPHKFSNKTNLCYSLFVSRSLPSISLLSSLPSLFSPLFSLISSSPPLLSWLSPLSPLLFRPLRFSSLPLFLTSRFYLISYPQASLLWRVYILERNCPKQVTPFAVPWIEKPRSHSGWCSFHTFSSRVRFEWRYLQSLCASPLLPRISWISFASHV